MAAAETIAAVSEPHRLQAAAPKLVLASASPARRALLRAAGLQFEAVATDLDEHAAKHAARLDGLSVEDTAQRLARLKASAVARPGALVIGCDQILVCDRIWFDKPTDLPAARAQLKLLRGRAHVLITAVTVLQDGAEWWRHTATPRLTMRDFSDDFLDAYLEAEGDAVLASVGAYRLEGMGLHLFDGIEGEHSAILGLSMLPLLRFLRSRHVIGT